MSGTKEKPAARRSLAFRLVRWVAGTVLGVVVVLAVGLLVLALLFPDEKIRRLALDELEQRLGVSVDSGPLELNLWRGLVWHEPRLRSRPGGRSPLRMERLVLEYSPLQLLRRRLVVRSLELVAPRVELASSDRGLEIAELLAAGRARAAEPEAERPEAERAGGLALEVQRLRISGGQLLLGLEELSGRIAGIEGEASLHLEQGRLEARVQAGWPLAAGNKLRLGHAGRLLQASCGGRITGRLEQQGWTLVVELELARLSVLGRELEGHWRLRLRASGSWPPSAAGVRLESLELLHGQRQLLAVAGRSQADRHWRARLQGGLPTPLLADLAGKFPIAGRLRLEDFRVAGSLDRPEAELEGRLQLDGLAIDLPRLGMAGGHAEVEVGGMLTTAGLRLATGRVSLEAEYLRLAQWLCRRLQLRVGGEARLDWSASPRSFELRLPRLEVQMAAARLSDRNTGGRAANLEVRLQAREMAWDGQQAPRLAAGHLQLAAGAAGIGPLAAGSLRLRAGFGGRSERAPWQWPQPLQLGGKLRLRNLQAGPLLLGQLGLVTSVNLAPGRLRVKSLQAELVEPSLQQWPGWRLPPRLQVMARGLLQDRRLQVGECRLNLDDWGTLALRGQGDLGGRRFSLAWQARARIESLLTLAAPWLAAPGLVAAGQLQGSGDLRGGWRGNSGSPIAASGKSRLQITEGKLQLGTLRLVGVGAELALDLAALEAGALSVRGGITAGRLELPALAARSLRLDFDAQRQTAQVGLNWQLAVGRLSLPGLFAAELRGARLSAEARLLGGKQGRLRRLQLELPSQGLHAQGQGQVMFDGDAGGGLRPRISGSLALQFTSAQPVEWAGGMTWRGAAGAELEVSSDASGGLQASGRVSFSGFDVTLPGFQAAGLQGGMQVLQRLAWTPRGLRLVGSHQRRQRVGGTRSAYDLALGPLRQGQNLVGAEWLRLGRLRLERPRAEVELRRGRLRLGNLQVGVLGGDVSADLAVVLAPAEEQALGLWLEASELDLEQVARVAGGDARVGGNMRLEARARPPELDAEIHLTRIGEAALRSLLVAIDPGGDAPLTRLREFLDRYQVTPRSAVLRLRRGLLDLEIAFDLGLAARTAARLIRGFEGQTFRLRSLPVGGWLRSVLEHLR